MESKSDIAPIIPVMDFDLLREAGLYHISQLSGKIWTDHNAHDPGITLLEILCYSIIDLGYRMTFDIEDILTEKNSSKPKYENTFHEPCEILSSAPVTINDYRKLVLENIIGVKNIWLKPTNRKISLTDKNNEKNTINVNGFYDVFYETSGFVSQNEETIKNEINNILNNNRNLCENSNCATKVSTCNIGITATIDVEPDADYSDILYKMIEKIKEYISPNLKLYTLAEMLEKRKAVTDIFEGSIPKLGFIDANELETFDKKNTLYVSDIINIIMQIKGVKSVKNLKFTVHKDPKNNEDNSNKVEIDNYKISIKKDYENNYAFRFYDGIFDNSNAQNKIQFEVNGLSFFPSIPQNTIDIPQYPYKDFDTTYNKHIRFEKDSSKYRDFDKYYTIQDDFPEIYKAGKENIADSETELRKAQRMQFKAYLLFFDQLFADFLARLDSVKYQLSWEKSRNFDEWTKKQKNYLFKKLDNKDIEDFNQIVNFDYGNYPNMAFDVNVHLQKKDRLLKHLLARFNEEFVDYSIINYSAFIESSTNNETPTKYNSIETQNEMLETYPMISYKRAVGINCLLPLETPEDLKSKKVNSGNYYAIEHRLYQKLGLKNYHPLKRLAPKIIESTKDSKPIFSDNRKFVKDQFANSFGLHVFEHTLFLPKENKIEINSETFLKQYSINLENELSTDPYSMKVTVVLPGWYDVIQNYQFRQIVENTIHEEFPAHIAVKICWIDPLQMSNLEEYFEKYLKSIREEIEDNSKELSTVVGTLSRLKNIYQEAHTSGKEVGGNLINKTVLGYTTLMSEEYEWEKIKNE